MPAPVTIISALLPPLRGGLADHTFHLANLLRETHAVSVISSDDVNHTAPFEVRAVISDWLDIDHLEREISQTPKNATLLWQYVPHMYGHGGVNLQLPKLWAKFQANGRRQLFIAHEIAADDCLASDVDIIKKNPHR